MVIKNPNEIIYGLLITFVIWQVAKAVILMDRHNAKKHENDIDEEE